MGRGAPDTYHPRVKRLEFWPDYGEVLLHVDGTSLALDELGLPADLVGRALDWVGGYDDAKVDPEGWDAAWVSEGRSLFHELRGALAPGGFEVVDWEGLWSGAPESEGE
jgi:hypothetical protein